MRDFRFLTLRNPYGCVGNAIGLCSNHSPVGTSARMTRNSFPKAHKAQIRIADEENHICCAFFSHSLGTLYLYDSHFSFISGESVCPGLYSVFATSMYVLFTVYLYLPRSPMQFGMRLLYSGTRLTRTLADHGVSLLLTLPAAISTQELAFALVRDSSHLPHPLLVGSRPTCGVILWAGIQTSVIKDRKRNSCLICHHYKCEWMIVCGQSHDSHILSPRCGMRKIPYPAIAQPRTTIHKPLSSRCGMRKIPYPAISSNKSK